MHNMIVNELQSSISCDDAESRMSIFNNMYSWYMKNYAKKIKEACLNNDESKLKKYAIEIENICNLSDLDKLKFIFNDSKYNELVSVSNEIFERIKNNKMITVEEYKKYVKKINELESEINIIYENECKHIISECMLDLEYLKRNGNFEYYSLRFNKYRSINNKKA